MMRTEPTWTVTYKVLRYKQGDEAPHFDTFTLTVKPDEYVLDGVERIWAQQDRTLVFRHACHHSACGACGMRVNGVEKLTCITPISAVTTDGGTITVEPLRHFPVISDLAVDVSALHQRLDEIGFVAVQPVEPEFSPAPLRFPEGMPRTPEHPVVMTRLVDCIECGLCVSACPVVGTNPDYLGPAALAGIEHLLAIGCAPPATLLSRADQADGLWRCHAAYECSAVCPSYVGPGERIMNLRRRVIGYNLGRLLGRNGERRGS